MKIDKDNPRHWLILITSALFVFAAIQFRIFRNRKQKSIVFFYQMHGNSQALMEYIQKNDDTIKMYFLAFPEYLSIYDGKQPLPALNMLNFFDMIKVAQSDAIITNYGALTLIYFAKFTNIKFVDTFHGILLLKFMPPPILTYLNHYDEVWLSSPKMQQIYAKKFGVTTKTVATGYGRTDKLVNGSYRGVKKKYSIPTGKKVIMIAPTWKHNDPNRNLLPFGMNENEFISYMESLAKDTDSFIIYRAHMLSASIAGAQKSKNLRAMPSNEFPDAEELLSAVDILVTDWSSLAFDFMVLDRPVIFIDTKPPFQGADIKRRSNPSARFGELVSHKKDFDKYIKAYLKNPDAYLKKHAKQIKQVKNDAYGNTADGKASQRYYQQLMGLIGEQSAAEEVSGVKSKRKISPATND